VSILLASLLIAAGSAVASGYFASRKKKRAGEAAEAAAGATGGAGAGGASEKPIDKGAPLPDFPCQLGDVILRSVGDEAWLEGGIVMSEDSPVSALFVAPEGKALRGVYVRPRPTLDLFWLAPVSASVLSLGAEPPTSLEHEGQRYERTRRLPLHARRIGVGAPDVGETVICAEYTGPGPERLLVLTGTPPESSTRSVWAGEALLAGMYDVLAGGKSTLE
jgi:hypothetical protein